MNAQAGYVYIAESPLYEIGCQLKSHSASAEAAKAPYPLAPRMILLPFQTVTAALGHSFG